MQDFTEGSEFSTRGIWFYCAASDNEKHTMEIGKNLLDLMDYNDDSGFMYYNSDKNTYRINVPKTDPFEIGQRLLDVEERFLKRIQDKMGIVEAKYIEKHKKDEIIVDAIYHLKLNQDNLTEKYNELCKKWSEILTEYKNETTTWERCLELFKEAEFLTLQYMRNTFDHSHHYMHHQLNVLLKLSIGEDTFEHIMQLFTSDYGGLLSYMFGEYSSRKIRNGVWCHRCISSQSICDECFNAYFDLEGNQMLNIIKKATVAYDSRDLGDDHDDITIEELKNTKMMIYDESDRFKTGFAARSGSRSYGANKFNYMVKSLDYMINECLLIGNTQFFNIIFDDMYPLTT